MTSDANGTYRGVYTYGLERISESDQVAVEGVPNDPLYYLYDGRGSVTQLVNTENHVRDKYRYTPFGVPMPGGQLTPNTRLFNNPYGYNGEDYDIESGLQFLRARYYNPETARFISRDSYLGDVMEPLSLNRYAYTANNPLKYTDPSGHYFVDSGGSTISTSQDITSNTSAENKPLLQWGSKGSYVVEVQQILKNQGYDLGSSGVDGIYGNYTENAVRAYQGKKGLKVDGKVGPKTWASLNNYANDKAGEGKANSDNDVACNGAQGTSNPGPTLMEAAELADHVYFKKPLEEAKKDVLLGGWNLNDVYESGSLRIGVYTRTTANGLMEYALVNRGTQDWAWSADLDDNIKQPIGKSDDMKNSIAYAEKFVKDNQGINITFVGHSKGGAEAAANAVATNRNAILFNPATVNLKAYDLDSSEYTASMTAYIVEDEILHILEGWFSKPIGEIVYLPTQHPVNTWNPKTNIKNAKENHLMSAVKDAIKEWEGKNN